MEVSVLDYGAGNILSVVNAIKKAGVTVKFINEPAELASAKKLIFPGVGCVRCRDGRLGHGLQLS